MSLLTPDQLSKLLEQMQLLANSLNHLTPKTQSHYHLDDLQRSLQYSAKQINPSQPVSNSDPVQASLPVAAELLKHSLPKIVGTPCVCGQCGGTYNSIQGPCCPSPTSGTKVEFTPGVPAWAGPELVLTFAPYQAQFLEFQRKRVLGMIGALESTLAVLKSEIVLLDGLLADAIKRSTTPKKD